MGAVYLATDNKLNRHVAIKVLPDITIQIGVGGAIHRAHAPFVEL